MMQFKRLWFSGFLNVHNEQFVKNPDFQFSWNKSGTSLNLFILLDIQKLWKYEILSFTYRLQASRMPGF